MEADDKVLRGMFAGRRGGFGEGMVNVVGLLSSSPLRWEKEELDRPEEAGWDLDVQSPTYRQLLKQLKPSQFTSPVQSCPTATRNFEGKVDMPCPVLSDHRGGA